MSKVTIRMKNKTLSKFHLGSGGMQLTTQPAASDLVSKGITAQPANPLTAEENLGINTPAPSQLTSTVAEASTGAPAERVAPETMPEADKQPAPKDLEQAPSQDSLPVALLNTEAPAEAKTPATKKESLEG